MSKRYPGGVIRQTPDTPTQASATGVWNMTDVTQAQQTNNWPVANVPNPMSRSLRFRRSASAYMNRTFGSPTNGTTWTISYWAKLGILGRANHFAPNLSTNEGGISIESDYALYINPRVGTVGGAGTNYFLGTTQVFRDPSAWYHIVVALDTTQATSSNRVKVYVNGTQVTSFSTASYPPQNSTPIMGSAVSHAIGRVGESGYEYYYDGLFSEFNFVDGQALAPTAFGQYDQFSNWTSKQYTGTYGTNGFYLPFKNNSSTGTLGLDYSGNNNTWTTNNFSVTPSYQYTTLTSGSGTYTVPANVSSIQYLVVGGGGGGSGLGGGGAGGLIQGTMSVTPGQTIAYSIGAGGAGSPAGSGNNLGTSGSNTTFGSLTAIGGGGGAGYVGGGGSGIVGLSGGSGGGGGGANTGAGAGGSGTSGQGFAGGSGSTSGGTAGGGGGGAGTAGQNVPSNSAGGNGGTGITWINGSTYAGGGGGVGNGSSGSGGSGGGGNANYSSAGGNGTANTGGGGGASYGATYGGGTGGSGVVIVAYATGNSTYDSMTDVPTQWTPYNVTGDVGGIIRGNYCTLNPLTPASVSGTTSDGNLKITSGTGDLNYFAMPTMFVSSGKWYAEVIMQTGVGCIIGIVPQNPPFSGNYFANAAGCGTGMYQDGRMFNYDNAGNTQSGLTGFTTGTVVGIALDMDNGIMNMYINGTIVSTGRANNNCVTYTLSSVSSTWGISFGNDATYTTTINYGQMAFTYAPPSGYKSLCTTNLPTPTIQQGNLYMNATTYTGNGTGTGSTQTISNGNFQPDLIWMKSRSTADYHDLVDSVRGIVGTGSPNLFSNTTDAEATFTGYGVSAVTSTGFTLIGNGSYTNANGTSYVGWQWQAGQGTNTTNTAGSITSTVSVNPTAGFSVVTYTGTGSSGTVGHGLGVSPAMMIVKSRNATQYWIVQHQSLAAITYNMYLQSTDSPQNDAQFTAKSSTTVTVNGGSVTSSGTNYVMYCWAQVAGYSAFGSYTGNGSADGPFIYTGFRPKWILIKNATGASDQWLLFDSVRNPYNLTDLELFPSLSNAEQNAGTNGRPVDLLSNGVKVRGSNGIINTSGSTYIYACFAEYPFKSALAR